MIVPAIVMITSSKPIFVLFFGPEWEEAGRFTSLLSYYLVSQLAVSPFLKILDVYRRQDIYLVVNMVRLILVTGVFFISYHLYFDPHLTLLIYSIILSLHYVLAGFQSFLIVRKSM